MRNPINPEKLPTPSAPAAKNVLFAAGGRQAKEVCRTSLNHESLAVGKLFDMHCHLSFAPHADNVLTQLCHSCAGAFAVTVKPSEYQSFYNEIYKLWLSKAGKSHLVRIGVGLHPWWIAQKKCSWHDVEHFEQLVVCSRFVGEVGLDFSQAHASLGAQQVSAFKRVAKACVGGKVISLHAVRAAQSVIDIFKKHGVFAHNQCIFHWFSGTSDELHQAIGQGCYFSINPCMLTTKKGRAYVQAIPLDRLLLESDQPATYGVHYPFDIQASCLYPMLQELATLRQLPLDVLGQQIIDTSQMLLEDSDNNVS